MSRLSFISFIVFINRLWGKVYMYISNFLLSACYQSIIVKSFKVGRANGTNQTSHRVQYGHFHLTQYTCTYKCTFIHPDKKTLKTLVLCFDWFWICIKPISKLSTNPLSSNNNIINLQLCMFCKLFQVYLSWGTMYMPFLFDGSYSIYSCYGCKQLFHIYKRRWKHLLDE